MKRDSGTDYNYYLINDGRPPLVSEANAEGTYYSTTAKEIKAHFKELYVTANLTDVRRETVVFTRCQRERAAQYNFDHAHCLGYLHHDRVIKALRTGMITDVPYTAANVRNALVMYGECPTCSRTKGTKHRQTGRHLPRTPDPPSGSTSWRPLDLPSGSTSWRPLHHNGNTVLRHQLPTNQDEVRNQAAKQRCDGGNSRD